MSLPMHQKTLNINTQWSCLTHCINDYPSLVKTDFCMQNIICLWSFTSEYAGSSASWTDGVWAFPEFPTKCLHFNVKIPQCHIPEACTQVGQLSGHVFLYSETGYTWMNCYLTLSPLLSFLFFHIYLLYSHHLLATVYESKGEFRLALQHEKEAYSIYKSQVSFEIQCLLMVYVMLFFKLRVLIAAHMQVGENHDSTKESSEYLKSLTQQAVILQKAINHIYSNTPSACIPPPKVCTIL